MQLRELYVTDRCCQLGFKGRALAIMALLVAANLLVWSAALLTFRHFTLLLGTATLAYTFGLRHAVDADHISAIDNVTRRMMQDGRRPLLAGFFFSLGHSSIVVLLSLMIASSATQIQVWFPDLQRIGSVIGTSVSAGFLLMIAAMNLLVLRGVIHASRRLRRGELHDHDDADVAAQLNNLGPLGRIFRPALRTVDRSWKMYCVGFLFGLGFDTATEIGLLGISAAAATQGLRVWWILLFPALFTAGMCLVDTADGILMAGAYGWAYLHPARKLYYNMAVTGVSVVVAVVVGGIELLGVIGDRFNLHGNFWTGVNSIGNHFGAIGLLIVLLFALSWAVSVIAYRSLDPADARRGPKAL